MNNTHLSNKDIYSMIIEPETADTSLRLHLDECQDCLKRLNRIKTFTKAFEEQVEHTEINWAIEKARVLSTVSDYRLPAIWCRWRTAFSFLFIAIISAFLFRQIYIQPKNDIEIEEMELLKEIQILTELRGEVELPQSILILAEWEEEDFSQFLNFFSPIEEESNEKKDFIDDSLINNRDNQFLSA